MLKRVRNICYKKSICSKPKPSQIFTLPRLREQKSQVDCKLVQKHGSIFLWERTFNSRRWKLINYLIIGFESQEYNCEHTWEKISIGQARLTGDLHITMSRAWHWQWTLELLFWCKLIFDCLIFIEFWHQTEPGLTERWWGMTKHQLECIRRPPAAASASHSHIWDISGGRGSHTANQRPGWRLRANQKPSTGPHRVIIDSDKSKQTNSQSNAVCDV